jgi:hypothetical protein
VGDLYEKCEVLFEAIVYYEKAYEIFEMHPDIDVELIAHLDVLNGLIFIFKKQGLTDKAFYYANTLHLINKALDPNHPNTFNSCLTLLKLLKEKKEPLIRDQRIQKKALKAELLTTLSALCSSFLSSPATADLSSASPS